MTENPFPRKPRPAGAPYRGRPAKARKAHDRCSRKRALMKSRIKSLESRIQFIENALEQITDLREISDLLQLSREEQP